MKMSVLYFSKSGNTKRMAECIVKGMLEVPGVEAKAFSLDAIDLDFVKDSKAVTLGTPTYLASMANEVKLWLDTESRKYNLAGKIGGAFATAAYLHGGGDIAIQSILSHLMVMGMLTYSSGGALGKPVIHLGPVGWNENIDQCVDVFVIYGKRFASKAVEIFKT